MLFALDMEFEGHPHSGLDDAKNIARVLVNVAGTELFHNNHFQYNDNGLVKYYERCRIR